MFMPSTVLRVPHHCGCGEEEADGYGAGRECLTQTNAEL